MGQKTKYIQLCIFSTHINSEYIILYDILLFIHLINSGAHIALGILLQPWQWPRISKEFCRAMKNHTHFTCTNLAFLLLTHGTSLSMCEHWEFCLTWKPWHLWMCKVALCFPQVIFSCDFSLTWKKWGSLRVVKGFMTLQNCRGFFVLKK